MSGSEEHSAPQPNGQESRAQRVGKHWLEYAIFAAAFGAAIFTARQAYLANKQLGVARDTLAVTRDQEQRQLRAYVYVARGDLILNGRTFTGTAELKNYGQTPAYALVTRMRLQTRPVGAPAATEPFQASETSRSIIGPSSTITSESTLDIPTENEIILPALESGIAVIYIVGQTEYRDAFDRVWVLDFRFRGHRHAGTNLWGARPTEDGNEEHHKP